MRRLLPVGVILVSAGLFLLPAEERKAATIPNLIQQLSSNDFHIRQHVAKQLGNLGLVGSEAVQALGKLLHDPYPDMSGSAAKAL